MRTFVVISRIRGRIEGEATKGGLGASGGSEWGLVFSVICP